MDKNTQKKTQNDAKTSKYERRVAQLNLRPIHSKDVNAGLINLQIWGLQQIINTIAIESEATGKLKEITDELYNFVDFKTGNALTMAQQFKKSQRDITSAYREYIYLHISILYSMLAMVCEADIEEASNVEADTDTKRALQPLLDYTHKLLDIWANVQPIKISTN